MQSSFQVEIRCCSKQLPEMLAIFVVKIEVVILKWATHFFVSLCNFYFACNNIAKMQGTSLIFCAMAGLSGCGYFLREIFLEAIDLKSKRTINGRKSVGIKLSILTVLCLRVVLCRINLMTFSFGMFIVSREDA